VRTAAAGREGATGAGSDLEGWPQVNSEQQGDFPGHSASVSFGGLGRGQKRWSCHADGNMSCFGSRTLHCQMTPASHARAMSELGRAISWSGEGVGLRDVTANAPCTLTPRGRGGRHPVCARRGAGGADHLSPQCERVLCGPGKRAEAIGSCRADGSRAWPGSGRRRVHCQMTPGSHARL
jgi:hypothetical protein